MKKINIFILILGFSCMCLHAQEAKNIRFEAEIDPIAYAMNGYSVHGIFVHHRVRTDLGFFGIEQPSGFNGNQSFQVHTSGCGIKINYLLNKEETWFAGLGMGYAENSVTETETKTSKVQQVAGIGLHAGYRWFLFKNPDSALKGFYLAPWASIDYNKPLNTIQFAKEKYTQNTWSVFPTVHIGYKF